MEWKNFAAWVTRGTYPRLYLPILVVVAVVVTVRYHYLINLEVEQARQRVAVEVSRVGHFLVPDIRALRARPADVQALLSNELPYAQEFVRLEWQESGRSIAMAQRPASRPTAPAWFVRWVAMTPMDQRLDIALPEGQAAALLAQADTGRAVDEVWRIVRSQLVLTGINVLIVFVALTWLLRANARMLARLSAATRGFQSGSLGTRMAETGTLESQAVARTFNAMASQIEQLVRSLQQSEAEQADQLHFTRQLLDALPLPVFVRSARDICLLVNPAWEKMFGVSSAAVVGTPMPSFFDALEEDIIDISDADDTGFLRATSQEVYSIHTVEGLRYVLYFKAPFSNRHGMHLGTIATLVDVTERERANNALL
jgi:PAS domain S-box-containing protein